MFQSLRRQDADHRKHRRCRLLYLCLNCLVLVSSPRVVLCREDAKLSGMNEKSHNVPSQASRPLSSQRPFQIARLDHLVLTVKDLNETINFYTGVLGMELVTFKGGRKALKYGQQKINLHECGREHEPKANQPTPGSADLCFITNTTLKDVIQHLQACEVKIVEGPVERTGAIGIIKSVYIRDPDLNLLEISNYLD